MICTLFTGGPTMARAAFDAVNSDKVDGRHAVGAGAGTAQRKGKLVATNDRTGRLPDDIIRKAPDADLLDGRDSSAYRVTGRAQTGSFVNINGCGSGEITSYTLHVTGGSRSSPRPRRRTAGATRDRSDRRCGCSCSTAAARSSPPPAA